MQNRQSESKSRLNPTRPRAAMRWWCVGLGVGLLLLPVVFLLDRTLIAALRPDGLPWLVTFLRYATWLGYGLVDIAVAVAMGVFASGTGETGGLRRGLWGGSAVAAAGLLDQVLKNSLCRARPSAADAGAFFVGFPCVPAPYALASFPSGHATTAFALATVLSVWYPRWTAAWMAVAAIVGWSRIALGSHFPSDVAAGAILGVAVALAFVRWIPGAGKCKRQNRQPTTDQ